MQLREDTERVWRFLSVHPALTGFILVGGTALTLHIGHRLSEDLDFALGELRLPRGRLQALLRAGLETGFPFRANDEPRALEDFEISGMDLLDYQQNFIVAETVRVTFFCPDVDVCMHLGAGAQRGPRVATMDEIFAMKCLVAADRSKTRDWFDLFVLMRDHGYTPADFENVFAVSGVPQKMEIALSRLGSGRPHQLDEGYESLLAHPPTLSDMADFFRGVADEAHVARAARVMRQRTRDREQPS